ncbi:helix-turn-helix transcriptional regulator [Streptomyces sp. NPDC050085]|uniref:helix-turn-helix transcriptional regulator n=1 Tax=Streptomyces sp. NPDC050085 TaxID=3365600 RepID=UPI0037B33AD5
MPLLTPVPPSDAIDVISTDERTIVDLADRIPEPFMALGRYRYLQARDPLPVQRHHELLVLAVPVRGAFAFDIDGVEHRVHPGQWLRIPPGRAYRTGAGAEPRGELMWLIVRAVTEPAGAVHRAVELLAQNTGPVIRTLPHQTESDLRRVFGVCAAERSWINDALTHHLLSTVVLGLAAGTTPAGAEGRTWPHRAIAHTLTWIEDHLTEPMDAAGLAALSGLSTSHFYEEFRAATGTSPKDYILRCKADRARDWLAEGSAMSVTEIAQALGFSSSQQFARVFRRYQHCAPSAMRSAGEGAGRSARRIDPQSAGAGLEQRRQEAHSR